MNFDHKQESYPKACGYTEQEWNELLERYHATLNDKELHPSSGMSGYAEMILCNFTHRESVVLLVMEILVSMRELNNATEMLLTAMKEVDKLAPPPDPMIQ